MQIETVAGELMSRLLGERKLLEGVPLKKYRKNLAQWTSCSFFPPSKNYLPQDQQCNHSKVPESLLEIGSWPTEPKQDQDQIWEFTA